MAISALSIHDQTVHRIFSKETNGVDPGIRRIQGWIEEAWAAGYDIEGRDQLKGKLLGTRKWIGATGQSGSVRSFRCTLTPQTFTPCSRRKAFGVTSVSLARRW